MPALCCSCVLFNLLIVTFAVEFVTIIMTQDLEAVNTAALVVVWYGDMSFRSVSFTP